MGFLSRGAFAAMEHSEPVGKVLSILKEEQQCRSLLYAEILLGTIRRSGFAPGIGNCICQKFVSGEINSTPIYCLLSRARWMETTRHSMDCVVCSFIRISVCPTNTISSI